VDRIENARALIAGQNWEEAVALLRPVAARGDPEANYLLGQLLFTDAGLPPEEGREALRRAADQDHPDACFHLATTGFGPDGGIVTGPVVDRTLLLKAAALGSVQAERMLGVLFALGEQGFEQNPAVARCWFERAASRGDASSQYDLGFMLLLGEGGETDVPRALAWLQASAMQDEWSSRSAAGVLKDIFERGLYGVSRDEAAAERWRSRERALIASPR
jgi:TPR repeat protein